MRIAIIDLGTNTFNILIVEMQENGSEKILFQTKLPVKLGEGGINDCIIQPVPFRRGIGALLQHQKTIEQFNVKKVFAFATSAIRDAVNGNDFVEHVKKETGFHVQVISGDREAELIYYGVRRAVDMGNHLSLIMDIGGGSTEFIIADREKIWWKRSYQLGAARLLEIFLPSDPIKDDEVKKIKKYLAQELKSLTDAIAQFPVHELIGASGSFDSLAEMIACRFYSPSILDGRTEFEFNMDEAELIFAELLKSTREERLKMEGLVEMRVDMMVISGVLIEFVLESFDIRRMRLSSYALKEGVLETLVRNNNI